jgi:HEAT repeat protein
MQQLSSEARTLVATLWQADVRRIFGRRASWNVNAIEQLGRMNEPAAIAYLAPALFSGQTHAKRAAARAIESLLGLLTIDDLPRLDESLRPSWADDTWRKLAPRELATLVGPDEPGAIALELASMHPNGFVREHAVRRLALRHDGSELPYLLLRLNDWVLEVRRAAIDAVHGRLTPDYASHFVQALALVVRLEQATRADHASVLKQIYALLTTRAAREPMSKVLAGASRLARRASFRILLEAARDELADVIAVALTVGDPVIRLWATRALPEVLQKHELRSAVSSLFDDASVPVRREAFRISATVFREDADDVLARALMDESPSVRAFARFRLADKDQAWFRRFYRDAAANDEPTGLLSAIGGLAETGTRDDAVRLEQFLADPRPTIRAAAVRYLIRLGGEQFIEATFERVMDPSSRVSSRARQAVERYVERIGGPRLWQSFEAPGAPHVRRNLLRLMSALPKWDAVGYLLEATLDDDSSLAQQARESVISWDARYNANQQVPTGPQLAAVRAALSLANDRLPSATAASMAFSLRSFAAD